MVRDIEPSTKTSEDRAVARRSGARISARDAVRPLRSIAIFGAVGALVAAVALPAYAATKPADAATATVQQLAAVDAQSLVVASEATAAPLARGTFTATTPDEIAKKKAEEAAAARAAAEAEAKAKASVATLTSRSSVNNLDLSLVAAGSGEVRYPLPAGSYRVERTLSGSHDGADLSGPGGTPIFAAAAGVVRTSNYHPNYGNVVVIDSVIGGRAVSTLYAHMLSSPSVSAGETVAAGQVLGQRGSTGRSSGPHLHFEVRISGSLVEPMGWLAANAG